ncbi:MAG: hypothetical protein FWF44_07080 [Defluviitaleaceae bacterium]|nr:hypothetical protein [Defluviitaleaceae bacterium]
MMSKKRPPVIHFREKFTVSHIMQHSCALCNMRIKSKIAFESLFWAQKPETLGALSDENHGVQNIKMPDLSYFQFIDKISEGC